MLACSPEPVAEEWAIHDFKGFGLAYISEYESPETVSRLARGIAEHGLAFAAWARFRTTMRRRSAASRTFISATGRASRSMRTSCSVGSISTRRRSFCRNRFVPIWCSMSRHLPATSSETAT